MIRLCFLIRQLNEGGAQRQLVELVKGLDASRFETSVITFYAGGLLAAEIERINDVRLICLGKCGRWDTIGFLCRLVSNLRRLHPDVLHGYLAPANLLTVVSRPFLAKARIVWGIRASDLQLRHYDWLTRLMLSIERLLARYADLIIVNSNTGASDLWARGFPADKLLVIPNGIDTDRFRPDAEARRAIRAQWGIADEEVLIGLVGRLDPMKDHETFLRAAAKLYSARLDVRFVCVGGGPTTQDKRLRKLTEDLGVGGIVTWAGTRGDMPAVYNALDILTSASAFGEGFPNAIGEAMACGVPCVVTDVGDSASVVGESGLVVAPGDHCALAQSWNDLSLRLAIDRQTVKRSARDRIETNYAIRKLIARTSLALEHLG